MAGLARARRSLLAGVSLGAVVMAAQAWGQSPPEEPFAPVNRRIESSDLSPVQLPPDLWRGLDAGAVTKWLAAQTAPPRSPGLAGLWRRLMLSVEDAPSAAAPQPGNEVGLARLEALYRSGLVSEIGEVLAKRGAAGAAAQLWHARIDIGLGAREKGCKTLAGPMASLPSRALRAEKQLLSGYCAAVAGDTRAAALAASLAREEGSTSELALGILGSLDGGVDNRPPLPDRLSLIDYRFLELTGPVDSDRALKEAEPALLVALAGNTALAAKVQVAAAEAALHLNTMTPEAVAKVYRRLPASKSGAAPDRALKRAQLFRDLEETQTPAVRARLTRTLLDEARRAGVLLQTARMLAPAFSNLWPGPDMGVMAESLVQIALVGGQLDLARRWAESAVSLQHWLALIDIADPQARHVQQAGLLSLADLAKRGRISPTALHRVVTVLDALGIDVPLGLWEAAGRVPQPTGGHLPPTGVLGELAQASEQKQVGRTIILAIEALGTDGPDGANILALGDTLKALKRAGLEADARHLALEALLAIWPGTSGS